MEARVFICSTYADLVEERRAVLEAIAALEQRHHAMESFGARPDLPLETCLAEVRRSTVLVVIVGHLYGSMVPDLNLSYSEAEYAEAYRLGKPCLVYLRHEEVPTLPRYVERDPEKSERLAAWKATLKVRHTVYSFWNEQDLALRVAADLSRELRDLHRAAPAGEAAAVVAPPTGRRPPRSVCKMCDRDFQINSFWKFFQEKSARYPNRPQVFVIHGARQEAHESFIQGLTDNRLRDHFGRKIGFDKNAICSWTAAWPDRGGLDYRRENLAMNLFGNEVTEDVKYQAATLSRLPCFDLHCLVIISHTLEVAAWDAVNDDLVRWYVQDYWGSLKVEENTPQFLIFLKVHYQDDKPGWWRRCFGPRQDPNRAVMARLRALEESPGAPCPVKIIEELTPVEEIHIRDWVLKYLPDLAARDWELTGCLDAILREGERLLASRPMAEVERHLEIIHGKYGQGN